MQFEKSQLYLNTETRPWVHGAGHPCTAGISSFGFGGTNIHAVVEEYTGNYLDQGSGTLHRWPTELMVWRRKTREELVEAVRLCQEALNNGACPELADLSASLWQSNPRTTSLPTLAVVADSLDDLAKKLSQALEHFASPKTCWQDPRGLYFAERPVDERGKVAFLFPGQGSQYPNMLAQVATMFAEVRETLDRAEATLAGQLDKPLGRFIYPPSTFGDEQAMDTQRQLARTDVAQPAIGAVSLGMHRLLRNLGVEPDFLAGHSYGEYAALCAANCLAEDDLLRLSHLRGCLIVDATRHSPGAMAAVEADADTAAKLLADFDQISLANLNSPKQTVISGTEADVQSALDLLEKMHVGARRLPVACAFHSPLVAKAGTPLREALAACRLAPPDKTVFSNTTGAPHADDPRTIAQVMAEHLESPVRFQREIEAMYAAGARTFVEVGPHCVLTGLVGQILADRPHLAVASDRQGLPGLVTLQHLLAQLLVRGVSVQLDHLFARRTVRTFDPARLNAQTGKAQYTPTTFLVNGVRSRPLHGPEPLLVGQSLEVQQQIIRENQNRVQPLGHSSVSYSSRISNPCETTEDDHDIPAEGACQNVKRQWPRERKRTGQRKG